MSQNQQLEQLIAASSRIVFFGGAGVSTESGIPDFRSVDGLYSQTQKQKRGQTQAQTWPPEVILSHHFFMSHTEDFYMFYRSRMIFKDARPNPAHIRLAKLEQQGRIEAVITQNIDGLHQAAGSCSVLELHGSVHRNTCQKCHRAYDLSIILNSTGVPHCPCGGLIKPDVVLYEENLDEHILALSIQALRQADLLIIGGTSLSVYPAAGLVGHYEGGPIVLINRTETPLDNQAILAIHGGIGEVLGSEKDAGLA